MPQATRRPASVLLAALLVLGGPAAAVMATQSGQVPIAPSAATETSAASGAVHSAGRVDLRKRATSKTTPSKEQRDTSGAITAPAKVKATGPSVEHPSVATEVVTPPAPAFASIVARDAIDRGGWAGWTQPASDVLDASPIDPSIAVGPEHVLHSASRMLLATDRQGDNALELSWADFFGLPPATQNRDPRIVYDELHARWIATEMSWECLTPDTGHTGVGYLDFAISKGPDPTGIWDIYYIPWLDQAPTIPAVGTSTTMVSFVAQLGAIDAGCHVGSTNGWEAFAFDWSSLITPPASLPYIDSGLVNSQSLRPALQTPATSPNLYFLGTTQPSGGVGSGDATYLRVTGTVAAHTASFVTATNLTAGGVVANMGVSDQSFDQPGGSVGGLSFANSSVVWQAGRLISTLTQTCEKPVQLTPEQCFRVTELSTATTTPTLVQDFYIVPTDGGGDLIGNAYLGGAALSDDGTLHLVWNQSSGTAGDFIKSYAARQLPGDATNTIGTPELLAQGESAYDPYTGWGSYQAIASDPQIPTAVWQGAPVTAADGTWVTNVSRLQPDDGTTYVPIDPVRVLDSRIGIGLSGQFTAKSARSWQVAGVGGIPANAVGVTGNVTVTRQQAAGSVSITPTNTNSPSTSTLNFPVGDNRANNVAVALSPSGTLSAVFGGPSGKKTDLIFDVSGYFVADDSGATFTPITPVRVLNSRYGNGLSGAFARGVPRTLTLAGTHGIPAEATAITGNLTVTGQTAPGSLSVTQTPTASPSTSNLNFPKGDNRANGVYAPLDGSGALSIVYMAGVAGSTSHVILDVTGYFVPGTGGLRYFPLNPGRVMDTRAGVALTGLTGLFTSNAPRTLAVGGHWGVPAGAQAITGNLTVTGQTGAGSVAMTFSPTSSPTTSTLNFPVGDNRANGVAGPLNAGVVSFVYNGPATKKTNLILDISGYFQ